MAWGDGDDERIIRRDLDELNRKADDIQNRQMLNTPHYAGHSSGAGGGLLLLLVILFPLVIILHLLGVDQGDGFIAGFVSICMGIYGLALALFLWSFKYPVTFFLIALPVIVIGGCIILVCLMAIWDWIQNLRWRFKRHRK